MFERVRALKPFSPETVGGLLVFVGFALFIAVFFILYPVLRDPVGTYDGWFPEDERSVSSAASVTDGEELPAEPVAAFRFVAETIRVEYPVGEGEDGAESEEGAEVEEPMVVYGVSFEDRSEPGDAEIVTWTWDLGDGNEARGAFVDHAYEGPGVYPVRLNVEDENGIASEVEGDIEVPEEGRSFGRVEAEEELDLSGIESAVEDAVVTLEGSIDDTLDSVGSTVRSVGIIVLFALAVMAATIVAWRVTRCGVMLLRPTQKMRLKVRSADMHVDIGGTPIEDAIADRARDEEMLDDGVNPELIEV